MSLMMSLQHFHKRTWLFSGALHLHVTITIAGRLLCVSPERWGWPPRGWPPPPWFQAFKNPYSSRCLPSTHIPTEAVGIAAMRTCEVGLRRTGHRIINNTKKRLCVKRWSDSIISLNKKDGQMAVTCNNLLLATSIGQTQVLLSAWRACCWYYLWVELQ